MYIPEPIKCHVDKTSCIWASLNFQSISQHQVSTKQYPLSLPLSRVALFGSGLSLYAAQISKYPRIKKTTGDSQLTFEVRSILL